LGRSEARAWVFLRCSSDTSSIRKLNEGQVGSGLVSEVVNTYRILTVLVTHDGGEALSLGDRFLVMQAGCLCPHPASDLQEYALG